MSNFFFTENWLNFAARITFISSQFYLLLVEPEPPSSFGLLLPSKKAGSATLLLSKV